MILFAVLNSKHWNPIVLSGMQGYLQADANRPVAVKQLFNKNNQSGMAEFLYEVVVVTAIKHRNLVNLKGCCVREDQRLLVYEFMDNNDLEHHLFRKITITRKIRMCSLVKLHVLYRFHVL